MAGDSGMMMVLVGVALLGGLFLLSQGGGLQGILGGGAAPTPAAEAPKEEEQPPQGQEQDGGGMGQEQDDMSPYERYESRSPFGQSYKYETRGFGGPGPFPPVGGPAFPPPYPRPFPPGPGFPPGPHPFPRPPPRRVIPSPGNPCMRECFGPFHTPWKCKQCTNAYRRGAFGPHPVFGPTVAAVKKSYRAGCGCGG